MSYVNRVGGVVVALRIPVLLDCRNPLPPYDNKHVALQSFPSMNCLSLFTRWTLYTLLEHSWGAPSLSSPRRSL